MGKAELTKLTNMCMVTDGKGNVLVQERNDPNWPGMSFPGGHVEIGETFVDSVIREVQEETGLTIENPTLCGFKHFYTRDGIRYVVFLYKADTFTGELTPSSEGEVSWIPLKNWKDYTWIPDFGDILEVYQNDSVSELFYSRDNNEWKTLFL